MFSFLREKFSCLKSTFGNRKFGTTNRTETKQKERFSYMLFSPIYSIIFIVNNILKTNTFKLLNGSC